MAATNGNGWATDFITVGAGEDARQIAIALQPEAACRPADREHRDRGRRESLGVALHRPLGNLEPLGELRDSHLPPRLEKEQEGHEPARTHAWSLFHKHDIRWRECSLRSSRQNT